MKFIAIDWDGTFTEDPDLWRMFIREVSRKNKMRCFFVTARNFSEEVQKEADELGIEAIYTDGKPKMKFCEEASADIHIWIDDMPELLFSEAKR